jgi:hypothetical protein
MPRIKTRELLERIDSGNFNSLKLIGIQNGNFCMMLETDAGSLILENTDGYMKEYPNADNALKWLKRKTKLNDLTVDIKIWNTDRFEC